ncbi:MAG: BMC domain-containing protein [Phycisphaerales bacterium]|nr:BMC domain-containing protein [Phycisphaerales bacterium]
MTHPPALALLEFSSIAVGTRASDALIKKAPIKLLRAGSLQPGKYAILFNGEVADVEESYQEGRRVGETAILDQTLLCDVDERVYAAVLSRRGDWFTDAVGVIETSTLAAVIQAADAAVKGANVEIVEIRLGDGLGGKGLAHLSGLRADVEAALEIGVAAIADRPQPPCVTVISRFDQELRSHLSKSTRFAEDG